MVDVSQVFLQQFGAPVAHLVHAPGRVNLIGEHTDYNAGFVLPMALSQAVWIALRPRSDRQVQVTSLDFGATTSLALDELQPAAAGWPEYVKGVAWALQQFGYSLTGWEGVMAGDVPIGAGLSSSAALEMAVARAFQAVSGFTWDARQMALAGQLAENQWLGVQTGIMDQLASAAGPAGQALLIDCRSLETQVVPIPSQATVVVLDTGARRGLVDSAYNERRAQCEAAAHYFGVSHLRDISLAVFEGGAAGLDDITRRRARHVITENDRVLQTVAALRQGDLAQVGHWMNASHASLRDDFEVSSPDLDAMVICAQAHPGCYGARMTGAGFGGCAVALVQTDQADSFIATVAAGYTRETGRTPAFYKR